MSKSTVETVTEQQEIAVNFVPKVALDDGSGNIAYAFFDQEGELFEGYTPSIIERGLGFGTNGTSEGAWTTADGSTYTVRHSAVAPENTCNRDYQISNANRVLVYDTLASAGLGGHTIAVGCTIPTTQYYNRNDAKNPIDLELVARKKASIMEAPKNVTGVKSAPVIESVTVFPEAIPAYIYVAMKSNGEMLPEFANDTKTLVVDLGRFTNDLALIGPGCEVIDFQTTNNGVAVLLEQFHSLLHREAATLGMTAIKDLSITDVETIFRRGYIGSSNESAAAIKARIDVSELVAEAKKHLNDLVFADIREITDNNLFTLDRIVFVGGGAYYLGDLSKQWLHTVTIPDRPEMAVVRGVHRLLVNN